jgi:hypothetical protein
MIRTLLLTIPLLVAPWLFAAAADTQQPAQIALPKPADFVAAGPACKRKVEVKPRIESPAVDFPKTYRCELTIYACEGAKTYRSSVRPAGTGVCDDYRKVHDALAKREVCCDKGSAL